MSRQQRILCGVPSIYCCGGKLTTDQVLNTDKCHSSHEDAFNCMARYLINKLGYKRISAREFMPNDGGYIRILPKKSKFGGRLVFGKEQTRFMPDKRAQGNRGIIINS